MRRPPSTTISVEIEKANGVSCRLDANAPKASDRPTGITWRTQRGDGFADGSFRLRRDVLRDYPDLVIGDTARFISGNGQVYYDGYVAGLPREIGADGSWVQVPLAGWMSSAKDRRFREIYVDRDTSRWMTSPSLKRQENLLTGGTKYKLGAGEIADQPASDGRPAVRLQFTRLVKGSSILPLAETVYSADIPIGKVGCDYVDKDASGSALTAADWQIVMLLSDDDVLSSLDTTADLTGTAAAASLTAGGSRKYAHLQAIYNGADGSFDGEWKAWFVNPYVIGAHGLSLIDGGIPASDIIRNVAQRFTPLDASGVQDTTYPIKQSAFVDPTYPFDAFLEANRPHLWDLSVFEDKKLIFESPAPLDDYDWQVRTDDPGVTFNFAGDSLTEFGNGVEVRFTDLYTGRQRLITPDDYPAQLLDLSPDNAMNIAGRQKWLTYDIPFPVAEADAVEYGRAYFYEATRAKAPVSITVGYYVRDRAGNKRPAAEVRCDQRIAITDHPNSAPRRIIDTSYTHDGRGLTISADRVSQHLSAIIDRITLARTASGL